MTDTVTHLDADKGSVQEWAAAQPQARPWAKGQLVVTTNGIKCFDWIGTRTEAIALQRRYFDRLDAAGADAKEYAERVIRSLIAHGGPPQIGQKDFDGVVTDADIALIRDAVLWKALREHVPDTGLKLEDVIANAKFEIQYSGDRDLILRAQQGETDHVWHEMEVRLFGICLLNPAEAVSIPGRDLFTLADPSDLDCPWNDRPVYLPRIPRDGDDARAMLQWMAFCDVANPAEPEDSIRLYAGFTVEELTRSGLGLTVRELPEAENDL